MEIWPLIIDGWFTKHDSSHGLFKQLSQVLAFHGSIFNPQYHINIRDTPHNHPNGTNTMVSCGVSLFTGCEMGSFLMFRAGSSNRTGTWGVFFSNLNPVLLLMCCWWTCIFFCNHHMSSLIKKGCRSSHVLKFWKMLIAIVGRIPPLPINMYGHHHNMTLHSIFEPYMVAQMGLLMGITMIEKNMGHSS